jgi:thiamine biosynthesis lipoprotein
MNRKTAIAVALFVCLCLLAVSHYFRTGAGRLDVDSGPNTVDVDSGYQLVMGTFARVVSVAKDSDTAQKCIQAALAEIRKVDELMSDYKSESEIGRANAEAADHPVQVGEWTFEVLTRSVEFSKLTDGAFDVTVGPLVDLFRTAKKVGAAPTQEQIAQTRTKVGFEKLELDEQNKTVRFTVEGMRLDLGAIAKGYAVDKAIDAAKRTGAAGAMVDLGGNIRCFGSAPKGRDHWLIGIQDPNSAIEGTREGGLVLTLKLTNESIATSGDYQQFALIAGKRYSHILDPHTGWSAEGLSSVTIITDNATDADALSTSVSVIGIQKGLALIEKRPNTEAILITSGPTRKIIKTPGAEKYLADAPLRP